MACSKLFSGDLPEISSHIIQNLHNNHNTLYSLTLVNRFWCRLAIPLLWEDPFSKITCNYRENLLCNFLDTYFLFLNENDKSKLKEIISLSFDSNLQKPLFNYPSLIKTINSDRIRLHVSNWISYNTISTSVQQPSNKNSYFPLTLIDCREFKADVDIEKTKVICLGLFKLFIENNASLNNLCIKVDGSFQYPFFGDICDIILKNPNFISEIFYFGFYDYNHSLLQSKSLKAFLSSIPSSIKHIDFSSNNVEVTNHFANTIHQSQSQLSSIKFSYPEVLLLDFLKCHSNTLTSINFFSCNFSQPTSFDALSYLTQLESLQFKYCAGLNSKIFQPLLNITTSLKIKTLVFIENRFAPLTTEVSTSIQLLIQKIGSYIENLTLITCEDELRKILFDAIIDFCEKIKFLHLSQINVTNIPQLSEMIFKLNNYLKYLTLEVNFYTRMFSCDNEKALKISSMILKELTKSLPPSLHYLNLSLVIDPDDLRIALKNCNQVELKRLLIRDWCKNNEGTNLKVIRDFVKEKNIEFLSYSIGYSYSLLRGQEIRHRGLEKLVEEIQSFIKMMRYNDLVIKVSDIDGTLMIS